MVYRAAGSDGATKIISVRRDAVRAYFNFFCDHHHYFKNGILNQRSMGDYDKYIVPPIRRADFNESAFQRLPENGVPADLDYFDEPEEEGGDEDLPDSQSAVNSSANGISRTVVNSRVDTHLVITSRTLTSYAHLVLTPRIDTLYSRLVFTPCMYNLHVRLAS